MISSWKTNHIIGQKDKNTTVLNAQVDAISLLLTASREKIKIKYGSLLMKNPFGCARNGNLVGVKLLTAIFASKTKTTTTPNVNESHPKETTVTVFDKINVFSNIQMYFHFVPRFS